MSTTVATMGGAVGGGTGISGAEAAGNGGVGGAEEVLARTGAGAALRPGSLGRGGGQRPAEIIPERRAGSGGGAGDGEEGVESLASASDAALSPTRARLGGGRGGDTGGDR